MRSPRTAAVAAAVIPALAGLAACSSSGISSSHMVSARSSNISFVVDGTTTYGTLEIPTHRSGHRLASALLLAGSGPTDRNGNQPSSHLTPNTLQLIADVLARQGIVSLRFDKYFSGRTGAGVSASDPAKITLPAFIKQADAAYGLLRGGPDIDTGKMLVVGHSEGAKYALLVAESASPRPAGLALIEPASERTLDLRQVQIAEHLEAQVADGTITAAVAQSNEAAVRQAVSDFRTGGPVTISGLLPEIATPLDRALVGAEASYHRSVDPIVPAALAAKVKRGTRVLVTDGTRDSNVPPSTIGPLVRALA